MSRRGERRGIRICLLVLIGLSPLLFWLGIVLLFPSMGAAEVRRVLTPFLLLGILAMMVAPTLLFRGSGSAPDPSDEEDEGGGGPPQPPAPPRPPRGGIPLQDAEPARGRLRDHARPGRRRIPQRRPTRAPKPSPAPMPKQQYG